MKNRRALWIRGLLVFVLAAGLFAAGAGCKSTSPRLTEPTAAYLAALADTGYEFPAGSPDQTSALARVIDLFSDFSHDPVAQKVRGVYAESLFFRDGFKEFTELDPLTTYMIESTLPLRSCRFTFEEPVRQGKDYYLRWTMWVNLKRDKPERIEQVIGMSHIRFDAEGRVVFQQDYWDPTDVLYRRIPVAGWMIDKVKARL